MTTAVPIRVDGPSVVADFAQFDLEAYEVFLRAKRLPESQISYDWQADSYTLRAPARFAYLLGADVEQAPSVGLPLAGHLFDYQRWVLELALEAKRFSLWLDTGLGKTACYLEWARQVMALTGGRVLILAPLQIIGQARAMAAAWYGDELPIERLATRDDLAAWCTADGPAIAITNYEKMIPGQLPELRYLAGLVADESLILKTGGGVIKWNVIKSAPGIPYKLSCTATPAPNDTMEFASQAAFLETIRHEGEVLWTYFSRDKEGNWRIKPHAREAFYRFLASWSIYMRDPAAFGFGDILATLPPPDVVEHAVEITPEQRALMYGFIAKKGGGLFADDRLGVVERMKLGQLAKGFLYDGQGKARTAARIPSRKPAAVAEIVRAEHAAGRIVLVWTVFDEEGEIIRDLLADIGAEVLTGSQSQETRLGILERFLASQVPILISKPQLLGYGLNFQHVRALVFSGIDDSFERCYQSIRRAYRYGQRESVRVHYVYVPELEGMMLSNVKRKEEQFMADVAIQEEHYRRVLAASAEEARSA